MKLTVALLIFVLFIVLIRKISQTGKWKKPVGPFPASWRKILVQKVLFYNSLSDNEKILFEYKVHEFISNINIAGVETGADITDKVLVAASAVIPIFHFPEWKYTNLREVLLYPGNFGEGFETSGEGRSILGMVGTGYMEGKMILSKPALHLGFSNATDKKNTAIHEFVHLIDKIDGNIDGVPSVLIQNQYAIPWLDLMNKKIDEIYSNNSDINPYGGTNRGEFFAVASEYFFEKPKILKAKHPQLYNTLEHIFRQNMSLRKLNQRSYSVGRNSACPCGSGKKYKHCCGMV